MAGNNGNNGNGNGSARVGTSTVKQGLAQMLKGGVIVSFVVSQSLGSVGQTTVWPSFEEKHLTPIPRCLTGQRVAECSHLPS